MIDCSSFPIGPEIQEPLFLVKLYPDYSQV